MIEEAVVTETTVSEPIVIEPKVEQIPNERVAAQPVHEIQWEIVREDKMAFDPEKDKIDIILPGGTPKQIADHAANLPQDLRAGSSELDEAYMTFLQQGVERATRRGTMYNQMNDPALAGSRHWVQILKEEAGPVGAIAPKFKDTGMKVTGEKALIRVRALMGKGGQMSFPLPHTGIWVTMVSPTESEILRFWTELSQERVRLGRIVYGASLSNEAVYTAKSVVDFALAHVIDTNLQGGVEEIRSVLNAHDIQHLAWACACMMYQDGFQFVRSVLTDDPSDRVLQHGRINVSKLQFIDRASLTEKQRNFLARRAEKKSKEALTEYANDMRRGADKTFALTEDLEVVLRVPSYTDYIDAGYSWIEGLMSMVESQFTKEEDTQKLNAAIDSHQRATLLCQYSHWVRALRVRNENATAIDKFEVYERDEDGTIDKLLEFFTADEKVRVEFFKAVKQYQEESCIAQICVPAASVTEVEEAKQTSYPLLIPVDAVSVFISLLINSYGVIMMRSENLSYT